MSVLAAQHMKQAAERVAEVKGQSYASIYGGLCHTFPVIVRQCGLCQAVAFSIAKAGNKDDRERAHARVLEDFEALTGVARYDVAGMETPQYAMATRRVLSAWIYYKRFAVSILGVEAASEDEEQRS